MAGPSLRETQRWLAGIILDPERLETGGVDPTATLAADAVTARIRLGAYTGGYPARIEEALSEAFPALRHVLGADAFHGLVHRYLPHVPAGIYNLSDVGANLPACLAQDELARDVSCAVDLARLELGVQRAFHATLGPAFDSTPLQAWAFEDWERAVVRFQPGVALVRSPWPIHDVWEARKQPGESFALDVEGRPQNVLVYRVALRVAAEVVPADEAVLLERLLAGATLGDAMASLAETGIEDDLVTAWFSGWVARGLMASVGPCSA